MSGQRKPLSHPYREAWSSSWTEEELWLSLDEALLESIRDPYLAWDMAFRIAVDAGTDFPDVRHAAEALITDLSPKVCGIDICFAEAVTGGPEK